MVTVKVIRQKPLCSQHGRLASLTCVIVESNQTVRSFALSTLLRVDMNNFPGNTNIIITTTTAATKPHNVSR